MKINLLFSLVLIFYLYFNVVCKQLYVKEDGRFKIVQFTDLHLGQSVYKDQQTIEVIHSVIEKEPDVDLIVFSGDLVSGFLSNGKQNWYQEKLQPLISSLQTMMIPYAVALGNHDEESGLTRRQVAQLLADQHDEHENVFTQVGPENITGATNYWLNIYNHNLTEIVARIWFLDSMGTTCNTQKQLFSQQTWGCVSHDTVQWMLQLSQILPQVKQQILYVHIPPVETLHLWNEGVTRGKKREDVNCASHNDNNLFSSIKKANITQVYFGHDHDNEFEGVYEGVRLAYGLKTGYGGYGPKTDNRGGRIVVLNMKLNETSDSETWVRYQDGTSSYQELSEKGVGDKQDVCVGPGLLTQMKSRGYPVWLFILGCIGLVFVCGWWLVMFRKPSKIIKYGKSNA